MYIWNQADVGQLENDRGSGIGINSIIFAAFKTTQVAWSRSSKIAYPLAASTASTVQRSSITLILRTKIIYSS